VRGGLSAVADRWPYVKEAWSLLVASASAACYICKKRTWLKADKVVFAATLPPCRHFAAVPPDCAATLPPQCRHFAATLPPEHFCGKDNLGAAPGQPLDRDTHLARQCPYRPQEPEDVELASLPRAQIEKLAKQGRADRRQVIELGTQLADEKRERKRLEQRLEQLGTKRQRESAGAGEHGKDDEPGSGGGKAWPGFGALTGAVGRLADALGTRGGSGGGAAAGDSSPAVPAAKRARPGIPDAAFMTAVHNLKKPFAFQMEKQALDRAIYRGSEGDAGSILTKEKGRVPLLKIAERFGVPNPKHWAQVCFPAQASAVLGKAVGPPPVQQQKGGIVKEDQQPKGKAKGKAAAAAAAKGKAAAAPAAPPPCAPPYAYEPARRDIGFQVKAMLARSPVALAALRRSFGSHSGLR
jgi:hypothetical protein